MWHLEVQGEIVKVPIAMRVPNITNFKESFIHIGFTEESPLGPIIMPGVNGDFVSNKQTNPSYITNVMGFAKIEPSGGLGFSL